METAFVVSSPICSSILLAKRLIRGCEIREKSIIKSRIIQTKAQSHIQQFTVDFNAEKTVIILPDTISMFRLMAVLMLRKLISLGG